MNNKVQEIYDMLIFDLQAELFCLIYAKEINIKRKIYKCLM